MIWGQYPLDHFRVEISQGNTLVAALDVGTDQRIAVVFPSAGTYTINVQAMTGSVQQGRPPLWYSDDFEQIVVDGKAGNVVEPMILKYHDYMYGWQGVQTISATSWTGLNYVVEEKLFTWATGPDFKFHSRLTGNSQMHLPGVSKYSTGHFTGTWIPSTTVTYTL